MSPALSEAYLEAPDRYTDFHRVFVDDLNAAGVHLLPQADPKAVVIELQKDESGQRILSVSARNVPTQYEVYYTVTFRVLNGTQELQPSQTISLTQDYVFDENALLAMDQQQAVLRQALARNLSAQVMRRLSALE
jgi:outer membrane lipopolysaccharide assembly protein LptE/RlpB